VRGFRGDGLAVIQKATLKSEIGVLKATVFVLGPLSNFAEIEVPASTGEVLASLFSVITSLEEMPSPPERVVRLAWVLSKKITNCPKCGYFSPQIGQLSDSKFAIEFALRSWYRTSPQSDGFVWIRSMSDLRTVDCTCLFIITKAMIYYSLITFNSHLY
jgi:hypothetical protein